MPDFIKKLFILFHQKKQEPHKIKVCWDFLAGILGKILFLTDEQVAEFMKLDDQDPKVIREIVREYVVPHYRYFPPENQEKIRNTLTYYLATDSQKLEWVFPSHQIPIDDAVGKLFYTIVWQELYGTDGPDPINPDDYEEDCNHPFVNSLDYNLTLKEKYNPTGEEPSIENIKRRLAKN